MNSLSFDSLGIMGVIFLILAICFIPAGILFAVRFAYSRFHVIYTRPHASLLGVLVSIMAWGWLGENGHELLAGKGLLSFFLTDPAARLLPSLAFGITLMQMFYGLIEPFLKGGKRHEEGKGG